MHTRKYTDDHWGKIIKKCNLQYRLGYRSLQIFTK